MNAPPAVSRNPGPDWGYGFLLWAERWWPQWFFRPMLMIGAGVGLAFMPAQRAHSRDYLAVVLGRPPRLIEVWRHFFAFASFLMLKLRAGRGVPVRCNLEPENAVAFEALARSVRPALFGTFHFGGSDLLGYLLGGYGRRVSIIRLRVGNSADTRLLGQRFGGQVSFLWINDPTSLLFELKTAIEAGASLAMKCDRLEFSAKTEVFSFLGARRRFPFTIYHLALIFERPVVLSVGLPAGPGHSTVHSSPLFVPDAAGKAANLARARVHFQEFLTRLERMLRDAPELWFNFLPLNPVVP